MVKDTLNFNTPAIFPKVIMEDFKVAVESLHSNKIKAISYEGEETYQEKPNVAQRLREYAQRVDFSETVDSESSEPAPKRFAQQWPWENAHSKLKQALTEVSVLSDVLLISRHHRQYFALDPVFASPLANAPPSYQYIVKKKSLGVAAGILRKGTASLSRSSTLKEKEFHKALSAMRQRWKLRRTAGGAIVGDLSYHSAGSNYASFVPFEVSKGDSLSVGEGGTVSVSVPRDLRGRSEIVVFLSQEPVREVSSLSLLGSLPIDEHNKQHRSHLPPWEQKLVAAQNVLFNQELFSQLSKEAYVQKPRLQHDVCSNRINVALDMGYWLSILHLREYEGDSDKPRLTTPLPLPPPRWDLVVALKQLLRDNHHQRSVLNAPRPATVGFTEGPEMRDAGVTPLNVAQIRNLAVGGNIFNKFIKKGTHTYNEERLQKWLLELSTSCSDPQLKVTSTSDLSLNNMTSILHIMDPSSPGTASCTLSIVLSVDEVSVKQIDGEVYQFPTEKERLLRVLRHQVVVHRMQEASKLAKERNWHIVHMHSRPLLSPALAKSNESYMEACSLVMETPDAKTKLEVLLEWSKVSVNHQQFASWMNTEDKDTSLLAPQSRTVALDLQTGLNFQQQFSNLLSSV